MSARAQLGGVIAAATILSLAVTPRADAGNPRANLEGTWTGSIKCKSFNGGVKDSFTLAPTMFIAQSGLTVQIQLFYGVGTVENYVGLLNPDAKKPLQKGELAVVACGTNDLVGDEPNYDEVGRISISTKPPALKATFKGPSIFSDPGTFPAEAGTCKWKFTRTDFNVPSLPEACGFPPP